MEIKTDYNVGDKAWYMQHNQVLEEAVEGVTIEVGKIWSKSGIWKNPSVTYHFKSTGYLESSSLFKTKEELLKSL